MEYQVSVERNGRMVPVGSIVTEGMEGRFAYGDAYLESDSAVPVSISLPLQRELFSPEQTRSFFEGLLPEGFTRRAVAQWLHLDEGDYLSILHRLGRECLGALCVTDGREMQETGYEEMSLGQVKALAAEGATKSAELITKSHLSLTGASGKVGLYRDEERNRWYLPLGTAPSTYIVKQSHIRLNGIVTNEQLAQLTAQRCGIHTPRSFIVNVGRGRDEDVLFATERYDRILSEELPPISGLRRPLRLHQEDFAQAMGIPASRKYEGNGEAYLKRMFEVLRKHSSDPITDQLMLWDVLVFDFLIGNTDAHIKNFSLLYNRDQSAVRLAPAYDIVSTVVYEISTQEMAFRIGGERAIDQIGESDFRAAAGEIGLGAKLAMARYAALCERFEPALWDAAEELEEQGFETAMTMAEQIMRKGGFAHI